MSEVAKLEIDQAQLADLISRLDRASRPSTIMNAMDKGAGELVRWVRNNRLTGPRPQYLGIGQGHLRASIDSAPTENTGDGFMTRIGTNKIYARIHEYGGKIVAKNGPYLKFQFKADKRWVSVKSVTIPARPFLTPAVTEPEPRKLFIDTLRNDIAEALEKQK